MAPTVRFVLLTALRDRLFASLFIVLVMVLAVSFYLGSAAVAEGRQAGVVYAAGSARVLIALGLAVFVAFHVERLYESRDIEALLSRPITRGGFVVAYWAAICAVAVLTLMPLVAAIFLFKFSVAGAFWWSLTVMLECFVVIAFAIFCGMSFERAIPTIFTTVGFYALARLIGFFIGIAEGTAKVGVNSVANPIMEYLGYLLPRLDLAGQTEWLIYGVSAAAAPAVTAAQSAVYVVLLLSAAAFDLRRKHF